MQKGSRGCETLKLIGLLGASCVLNSLVCIAAYGRVFIFPTLLWGIIRVACVKCLFYSVLSHAAGSLGILALAYVRSFPSGSI